MNDCGLRISDCGLKKAPDAKSSPFHSAIRNPQSAIPVHPAEGGAAAGSAEAQPAISTSLATLLTSHILQDGEIVLLILKPSLWYMILSGLRFTAACVLFMAAAVLFDERLPARNSVYINIGVFAITGRLVWTTLQWMGRIYVLTDRRILSLSGVFSIDVFDCPLRRVARTRIIYTARERVVRIGSIQIIPAMDDMPDGVWFMVPRPVETHEAILAAINRTKVGTG